MTQHAPLIGVASASILAQAAAAPWWIPVAIQLGSLAVAYFQGQARERRRADDLNNRKAADAPSEQHGAPAYNPDDDR